MKYLFVFFLILALGASSFASERKPSDWKLRIKTRCPDLEVKACVGGYGFEVASDGTFVVGPDPIGRTLSGTIKPEELYTISKLTRRALSFYSAKGKHTPIPSTDMEDDLTLMKGNDTEGRLLASAHGRDLFFRTAHETEAIVLLNEMHDLTLKYYPDSFGDLCHYWADQMKELYLVVQKCEKDTDCAYFDSSFQPATPDQHDYIIVDNCTEAQPLVVGNQMLVQERIAILKNLSNSTQNACAKHPLRSDCNGPSGFDVFGRPAACQQGVCSIPNF